MSHCQKPNNLGACIADSGDEEEEKRGVLAQLYTCDAEGTIHRSTCFDEHCVKCQAPLKDNTWPSTNGKQPLEKLGCKDFSFKAASCVCARAHALFALQRPTVAETNAR